MPIARFKYGKIFIRMSALLFLIIWHVEILLLPKDVIVTLPPYLPILTQLTEEICEAGCLLEQGGHPHFLSLPPDKINLINNTRVWFGSGGSLEENLSSVLSDTVEYIDLQNGLPNLRKDDLHLWLSPARLKEQAILMEQVLIRTFPDKKDQIKTNLVRVLETINDSQEKITSLLKKKRSNVFLCSHDALGYFCEEFKFTSLAFDANGYEPSFCHLEDLEKEAKKLNPCLIVLVQGHHEDLGLALAEHLQLPVFMLDPCSKDILKVLENLAHALMKQEVTMDLTDG